MIARPVHEIHMQDTRAEKTRIRWGRGSTRVMTLKGVRRVPGRCKQARKSTHTSPKYFGVKFSLREIGGIFSIKIQRYKL